MNKNKQSNAAVQEDSAKMEELTAQVKQLTGREIEEFSGSVKDLEMMVQSLTQVKFKPRGGAKEAPIKELACSLLTETVDVAGTKYGLSYNSIVAKIKEKYPEANTTAKSLAHYATKMRKNGTKNQEEAYASFGQVPEVRLP